MMKKSIVSSFLTDSNDVSAASFQPASVADTYRSNQLSFFNFFFSRQGA